MHKITSKTELLAGTASKLATLQANSPKLMSEVASMSKLNETPKRLQESPIKKSDRFVFKGGPSAQVSGKVSPKEGQRFKLPDLNKPLQDKNIYR